MRPILLALMLLPGAAKAASPELLCDPDATVRFEQRWLRGSVVRMDEREFPWTGREQVVSGAQLRNSPAPSDPAELTGLPETTSFLSFGSADSALLIERDLLQGSETDGLVIERASGASRLFHCRSR